ncbi:MAG: amino acid racemase [Herbinix sp.]|jgi:serine/alanine racemase|nr:amino acid racemase [Herbinix sp.]
MLKKSYAAVDIFKFICSIMIIGIHCPPFLSFHRYIIYWGLFPMRIAVPFFFMTAAYFLFQKLKEQNTEQLKWSVMKAYTIRIGKLWIFWSIIYYIIRLTQIDLMDKSVIMWNMKVIARDFIFSGISGHLWYMPALLTSLLLIYYLQKKFSSKIILVFAGILYVIGLLGNTYQFLLPERLLPYYEKMKNYIVGTRNGLFFGFLYCIIGAMLVTIEIDRIRKRFLQFMLAVSVVFMLLEFALVLRYRIGNLISTDLWMGTVPVTLFLFMLLLKSKLRTSPHTIWMRKMSLTIYLFHPAFITIFGIIFPSVGIGTLEENSAVYFISVTVSSVISAIIVEGFKNRFIKLKAMN